MFEYQQHLRSLHLHACTSVNMSRDGPVPDLFAFGSRQADGVMDAFAQVIVWCRQHRAMASRPIACCECMHEGADLSLVWEGAKSTACSARVGQPQLQCMPADTAHTALAVRYRTYVRLRLPRFRCEQR